MHYFECAEKVFIFSWVCSSMLWSGEGNWNLSEPGKIVCREDQRSNDPYVNIFQIWASWMLLKSAFFHAHRLCLKTRIKPLLQGAALPPTHRAPECPHSCCGTTAALRASLLQAFWAKLDLLCETDVNKCSGRLWSLILKAGACLTITSEMGSQAGCRRQSNWFGW